MNVKRWTIGLAAVAMLAAASACGRSGVESLPPDPIPTEVTAIDEPGTESTSADVREPNETEAPEIGETSVDESPSPETAAPDDAVTEPEPTETEPTETEPTETEPTAPCANAWPAVRASETGEEALLELGAAPPCEGGVIDGVLALGGADDVDWPEPLLAPGGRLEISLAAPGAVRVDGCGRGDADCGEYMLGAGESVEVVLVAADCVLVNVHVSAGRYTSWHAARVRTDASVSASSCPNAA